MIDLVYRTVQTIINKENNGYVSPTEFNIIANNVQMEIFRNYFEDENRDKNKKNKGNTNKGYSNLDFNERQRITQFAEQSDIAKGVGGSFPLPADLYFIEDDGIVSLNVPDRTYVIPPTELVVVEEVQRSAIGYLKRSTSAPTATYPVYENLGNSVTVFPNSIIDIRVRYLRTPKMPNWTYLIIGGKEIFNPSNTSYQDFELHESEFSNIVVKILGYFSINLREDEVSKIAMQLRNEISIKDNN